MSVNQDVLSQKPAYYSAWQACIKKDIYISNDKTVNKIQEEAVNQVMEQC